MNFLGDQSFAAAASSYVERLDLLLLLCSNKVSDLHKCACPVKFLTNEDECFPLDVSDVNAEWRPYCVFL